MSDSEDSDSFLSADEGGGDAGNESSDITLSSDSEPDEGGKAAPGDPDSSDITLSSDSDGDRDGDHAKQCSVKLIANEPRDTESEAKGANQPEAVAQTESGSIRTSGEADFDEHVEQQSLIPKPEKDAPKSSVSLPGPSSVLPCSSLDIGSPCTESKAPAKGGPPNAPSFLEPTESALNAEMAVSLTCSNTSVSPVKRAPTSQVPQTQSANKALAPAKAADDAGGASELHASPSSAEPNVPCAGEGWGDQDEDIFALPEVAADAAQGEASDWGWTSGSTSPAEAAPTASESTSPPPSGPSVRDTAPQLTPPAPESSRPPLEPALGRRRPERRERRGPLKLGAKKLGAKLATPPKQPGGEGEAAAVTGSGGSQPSKDGGAATSASQCAPAPAVSSQQEQTKDAWGSWETWGSSLLSSAAGVTKTVLETVETGFGAPEPEDLARITRQEQEQETTATTPPAPSGRDPAPAPVGADPGLGLGSWFGGVSQLLGQTSSLVVNTGLDTLEAIGKKTMNVLQDDQLGIHDTISQLSGQKPSLSQALREAREKRGDSVLCSPATAVGDRAPSQPPTFSHMFDQCDGTVHLEALEMLSARCRSRVTAAKGRVDEAAGTVLDMIEELCTPDELAEVEVTDFEAELSSLLSRLLVPIKPSRLIIAQSSAGQWLATAGPAEPAVPRQVLGRAVRAAAEIGAGLAEFLHKLSELRLVEGAGGGGDPVLAARHLAALTALVAAQAGRLAARFAETLSGQTEERAAAATTDIYLEVSYLQKFCGDSLSLMAPVLQMAALNSKS